ncbi:hypothetical protein B9Z55_022472 [Caenorhabditis nigoni]|uniref:Uncharacterized protein n=1 Tax=Caenorhabditis nigoni TaxID=1611254 RepID=A0A2G5SKA5_9PELO|nr:hypothetical protein B9Z55_022472 [Caenorhabditis nigoni]
MSVGMHYDWNWMWSSQSKTSSIMQTTHEYIQTMPNTIRSFSARTLRFFHDLHCICLNNGTPIKHMK